MNTNEHTHTQSHTQRTDVGFSTVDATEGDHVIPFVCTARWNFVASLDVSDQGFHYATKGDHVWHIDATGGDHAIPFVSTAR
eukprot:156483-Prorocentrum_minimum.AAC.1